MKSKGQEDVQCPKCKQNFKVTLETPFSILIAAVVIIVLLVNVCLYIFKPDINFLYMAGVMLVGIIAIISCVVRIIAIVISCIIIGTAIITIIGIFLIIFSRVPTIITLCSI